jgi:hypothetical protein
LQKVRPPISSNILKCDACISAKTSALNPC